jgi:hypothetical protein
MSNKFSSMMILVIAYSNFPLVLTDIWQVYPLDRVRVLYLDKCPGSRPSWQEWNPALRNEISL